MLEQRSFNHDEHSPSWDQLQVSEQLLTTSVEQLIFFLSDKELTFNNLDFLSFSASVFDKLSGPLPLNVFTTVSNV
jgi:hypothetical protein